jgi:hypothetical protein
MALAPSTWYWRKDSNLHHALIRGLQGISLLHYLCATPARNGALDRSRTCIIPVTVNSLRRRGRYESGKRRRGEGETRRHGEERTRGLGDTETRSKKILAPRVPASPRLPVPASFLPRVSLSPRPFFGAQGRIQTFNLWFVGPALRQLSYSGENPTRRHGDAGTRGSCFPY